MRNLRHWVFTAILTAGCGVATPVDDGEDLESPEPPDQQATDATLVTNKAKECINEGAGCQVACFTALPLTDMQQMVSGCEGSVNSCMSNPQNARDCIENEVRSCVQEARDELDQHDLSAAQQDVADCQTGCIQTAKSCVDDLAAKLPDDVLQCANSTIEDFQDCTAALNQCDFQALADAVQCDDAAYDDMADCLADALSQQSPAAAQACIEQMMTDCNLTSLQNDPCVTDLADCASDAYDAFTSCMP
jgi:hypothetical protein